MIIGRLVVIKDSGKRTNRKIMWEVVCQCGATTTVRSSHLIKGLIRSCGCLRNDSAKERAASGVNSGSVQKTHGRSRDRLYPVYRAILQRCEDPKNTRYHGRGIRVCRRWQGKNGFVTFLSDMGEPPTANHTIERKDNNKGYCPSNCRWATHKEQARNRRSSKFVEYNGTPTLLVEVAEMCGIPYKELWRRLARGWTMNRATTQKLRPHEDKR